jgi:DNA-binding NarL/FixJ family response regulator
LGAVNVHLRQREAGLLHEPISGALIEPLTERERQILRLLATGLSSTRIAAELVIAVSTTRSYLKSIYRKLDAHSRDEAVARARTLGWL